VSRVTRVARRPDSAAVAAISLGVLAALAATPAVWGATACFSDSCAAGCSPLPVEISTLVPASEFPPGASTPIAFVDPDDGRNRRLIATQQGAILVWEGTSETILPTFFLDLRDDVGGPVLDGGERGLLALAVDPDYAQTGELYVFYSAASSGPGSTGDIVIERYQRSAADPDIADPASATTILVIEHSSATNHNGGWLAFGLDGFLYISTGDGGGGCDSQTGINGDGQSPDTLAGKMLRIDVRGVDPAGSAPDVCGVESGPYTVPSDNPFIGLMGACDEVWALGLRNPFRFSFDRETGDLYIGDVGQAKWEEINLQAASTPAPVNFGWVCREGCETAGNDESLCSTAGCPVDTGTSCEFPRGSGFWDPILCHYNGDWGAIMGGYRYRGALVPSIAGDYVYGDPICGELWKTTSLDPADPTAVTAACWASGFGGTYGFAEDHLGELYVVVGGAGRIDCIHNGEGCDWAGLGDLVFGDGFESGDTSAWSWVSGSYAGHLAVNTAAARSGSFGLEVTVGGTCSAAQDLVVTPPVEGTFLGCNTITASGVGVVGTGATFAAGSLITLGEDFSVPSLSPFRAVLDTGLLDGLAYVRDDTPQDADTYRGRFSVRLDDLSIAAGDTVELFNGYSANGDVQFKAILRADPTPMENQLVLSVRQDDGSYVHTAPGEEQTVAAGWNTFELRWGSGAGSGSVTVSINGTLPVGLSGIDNDQQEIDSVRAGYVGGQVTTTGGSLDLDSFTSHP
jgi:glucose/arabinose dehydrogenase